MQRSSYINWLLDQNLRRDPIGDLSRWLIKEMDNGFDPTDMFCILEHEQVKDDFEKRKVIYEGLAEYGFLIKERNDKIVEISDLDALERKLDVAIKNEDYLKAAELRDEIKKLNCKGNV